MGETSQIHRVNHSMSLVERTQQRSTHEVTSQHNKNLIRPVLFLFIDQRLEFKEAVQLVDIVDSDNSQPNVITHSSTLYRLLESEQSED